MNFIFSFGLSYIFFMANHILRIYPLITLSNPNLILNDNEDCEGADNNNCIQTDAFANGEQENGLGEADVS